MKTKIPFASKESLKFLYKPIEIIKLCNIMQLHLTDMLNI